MGTLFWLFPQTPTNKNSLPAEVVELSPPAGSIGSGPSDNSMYVIFPIDKEREYGMHKDNNGNSFAYLPPWNGEIYEEAVPDEDGHFLHYTDVDDHRFHVAHIYASIRFTLDVWESYYGRSVDWHFRNHLDKAEIVILPDFYNAQIGMGFVEVGTNISRKDGSLSPFSLNFDVLAHEVGHGLVYAEVGIPGPEKETAEFLGFQESCGDIISMIATLHFESVINAVLAYTHGNLYVDNHFNRFAEVSSDHQIRMAANDYKLSDFSKGWKDEHILAQPLTGAIFDIFMDIFHGELLQNDVALDLEPTSSRYRKALSQAQAIQQEFDNIYETDPNLVRESLISARDILAVLMIETWARLGPNYLHYTHIRQAMLVANQDVFAGRYLQTIDRNFAWREVGTVTVGPRLPKDKEESHDGHHHHHHHDHSRKIQLPENTSALYSRRWLSYAERYREVRMGAYQKNASNNFHHHSH